MSFLDGKGVNDAAVSFGLHHSTRTLRDQWVNNGSTALEDSRKRNTSLWENEDLRMRLGSLCPLWRLGRKLVTVST